MTQKDVFFAPDKKTTIIGLGISNMPIAYMLKNQGFNVTLRDKKAVDKVEGFDCIFGDDYLKDLNEDILVLAPAIHPDTPEILEAKSKGAYVTSDVNEYFKRRKGKIIAITGSDGKTTTTTLIYEILKKSGKKVLLGGNIGFNLCTQLKNEDENTYTVCELSSFQLSKLDYAPDIAVITNVSPNHLDWHNDMADYINAKKNIFRLMKDGKCVINSDDETSMSMVPEIPVQIKYISCKKRIENGVYFDGENIYSNNEKVISGNDILIPGIHNRYNFCEAIAATENLANTYDILSVAKTFPGVPHRCQLIRELNGVKYYNSSIDSSPTRTAACLNSFNDSFNQKIIVICGGYDKKIPLEPLIPLFKTKAKAVITMGITGEKINQMLSDSDYNGLLYSAKNMSEAVNLCKNVAKDGDIAVLSPAAASFDMYKNFEERGEIFVKCVNSLE